MTNVLRAELLKLRTTRTALGFAAAGVLLVLLGVLVSILAGDPSTSDDKRAAISIGGALSVVLLLFGVVGATAEYRHRTVAPAALIEPVRMRLTVGRMLAYGLAGLAVGALMLVVALAIGIPLLAGTQGPSLDAGDYAQAAGGSLLACGFGAMLGIGLGVLIRNQVAAIVGTLIFLFVAEPLIGLASSAVRPYLIGNALGAVGDGNGRDQLTFAAAVAVTVAWTALALAAALIVDRRRDIT